MAGRLVIPKPFREALGIGRGGEVEVELVDGQVVVSRPVVAKHVVQRSGRSVIVADSSVLVPAIVSDHEAHDLAFAAAQQVDAAQAHLGAPDCCTSGWAPTSGGCRRQLGR